MVHVAVAAAVGTVVLVEVGVLDRVGVRVGDALRVAVGVLSVGVRVEEGVGVRVLGDTVPPGTLGVGLVVAVAVGAG